MLDNMEHPLVSVVTITRNRGKLIGRCIKSVLAQTYQNIEHIVVDGASEDDTDEVVASFHDDRLHFLKLEENWSLEKTYKYGTAQANGKYICFLDSDDEYLPTKVEKQINLIESLPKDYGMVYCWMTYFDSSRNNAVIRVHNPQLRGFVPAEAAEKPTVSGTPIYFFRKEVYDELDGWNWNMPIINDWEMGARCCHKWKVDYVPESLVNVYENHCYIRQTDEILKLKSSFKKRVANHAYFLDEFKATFDKNPGRRGYHYSRMSYYSFRISNYKNALKYGLKFFNCKAFGI
jgi:glycosyltransferase involved in cell wall biosynthesis